MHWLSRRLSWVRESKADPYQPSLPVGMADLFRRLGPASRPMESGLRLEGERAAGLPAGAHHRLGIMPAGAPLIGPGRENLT